MSRPVLQGFKCGAPGDILPWRIFWLGRPIQERLLDRSLNRKGPWCGGQVWAIRELIVIPLTLGSWTRQQGLFKGGGLDFVSSICELYYKSCRVHEGVWIAG